MAEQLAGACESAASQAAGQAAVTGAESAKATVAKQIEAVQKNGYSPVSYTHLDVYKRQAECADRSEYDS